MQNDYSNRGRYGVLVMYPVHTSQLFTLPVPTYYLSYSLPRSRFPIKIHQVIQARRRAMDIPKLFDVKVRSCYQLPLIHNVEDLQAQQVTYTAMLTLDNRTRSSSSPAAQKASAA
jgi:hypothetical protein